MAEPGIEIPVSIGDEGSTVTLEKIAASVLELTKRVDDLNKTTQQTKGAVQFTAFAAAVNLAKDAFGAVSRQLSDFSAEMDRATAFGSKFQNLSLQYNTSAEALQKLTAAGKPFGVSTEQIARSLSLVERSMSKMGPAFKKYGIDQREIAGKDAAERFAFIAGEIGKIKNPTEQAAASFALLKDRSGAFLKLIRDPAGVQGAISDFEKFGLAVSNNAVGALDKLGNQRDLIRDIFTSLKTNLLGAVAASPALQEAIRVIAETFGTLSKFVKDNEATITAWVNTAVVVAADALVFFAKSVLPPVIDALTVMALGVQGAVTAFRLLAASAKLAFEVAKAPANAAKAWDDYKKSVADAVSDGIEGAGKIVDANIAVQNKAAEAAVGLSNLRDRIAEAAKSGEGFAAPIKAAGEAAGLSAEQIDELVAATTSWEEKMKDVAKGTGNAFAELAEKHLPEIEQKIGALTRQMQDQALKLIEDFNKQNEALAKKGLPPLDSTSLQKQLADLGGLLNAKISDIQAQAANAVADVAEKRLAALRASVFGSLDAIKSDFNDLASVLAQVFDTATKDAFTKLNFDKLNPAQLDSVVKRLEEMDQQARAAGKSVEGLADALKAAKAAQSGQAGNLQLQTSLLREQAGKIKEAQDQSKLLNETRKKAVEILKQEGVSQKVINELLPKAAANAFSFSEALSVAADAAQVLGKTSLGNFVNGLLAAAAAGEQAAKAIKDAQAGGSKLQAGIAVAGAAAGVIANIQKSSQTQNQGKAVLAGAGQGAAFGSKVGGALGPGGALVGGIIGGIAGGLQGFFASGKFKKIAKDAGKVLGTELSDETVKKIQEDSKKLGISIQKAALLNIGTAIEDSGKAASTFGPQIQNLIKGIADGSIPAKEGMDELAKSFGAVADEALKAGRVGDRALVGIIKQARASGVESPEIKAFVNEQLDRAVTGFNKFAALFKKLTKEEVDKLGKEADKAFAGLSDAAVTKLAKNTGVIFGAVFNALVSEQGIVGAVDQMKESFNTLRDNLSKTLGPEAVNSILGPFGAAFDTLGNEKLRPIFEGIDGLSQAMQGLANAGFLTTEQFTAIQQATSTLFDEAIAGGADMKTALTAVAPSIQAAISAAEQFGVPLDADTQRLKDLAEQNGIAFKTDPQQQMLDVLTSIAEVLGAKLPDSIKKTQAAVSGMAGQSNAAFDNMQSNADGFVGTVRDRLREVAENTGVVMNEAAVAVSESFNEMALAGTESFEAVLAGSDALALSMTESIPLAAEEAIASLRELQDAAAEPISVGGGGATGGTGGTRQVTANVSVNLGINENPLAAAQTAAQMRQATVSWVAEAIEDRIPSIISAVEGG